MTGISSTATFRDFDADLVRMHSQLQSQRADAECWAAISQILDRYTDDGAGPDVILQTGWEESYLVDRLIPAIGALALSESERPYFSDMIEKMFSYLLDDKTPSGNQRRRRQLVSSVEEYLEKRGVQLEASTPANTETTNGPEDRALWLARAMLTVREHPEWPDSRIADKVGKAPSTLSRSPEYKRAAALARGDRSSIKRGHVDKKTRTVEAYADVPVDTTDDSPDGAHPDRGEEISGSEYCREYCSQCDAPMRVIHNQVGRNPLCEDCSK